MELVRGKKTYMVNPADFYQIIAGYGRITVDLGAGDGRFVRHMATKYPHQFFLGIDACRDNLAHNSRKGPANTLFVVANALSLPVELRNIASELTINFPWGSLLQGLLDGDPALLRGIMGMARPGARLEVRLNGGALIEAGWSIGDGTNAAQSSLAGTGFAMEAPDLLSTADLRSFPSSWSKRIAFGRYPQAMILRGTRTSLARTAAGP